MFGDDAQFLYKCMFFFHPRFTTFWTLWSRSTKTCLKLLWVWSPSFPLNLTSSFLLLMSACFHCYCFPKRTIFFFFFVYFCSGQVLWESPGDRRKHGPISRDGGNDHISVGEDRAWEGRQWNANCEMVLLLLLCCLSFLFLFFKQYRVSPLGGSVVPIARRGLFR